MLVRPAVPVWVFRRAFLAAVLLVSAGAPAAAEDRSAPPEFALAAARAARAALLQAAGPAPPDGVEDFREEAPGVRERLAAYRDAVAALVASRLSPPGDLGELAARVAFEVPLDGPEPAFADSTLRLEPGPGGRVLASLETRLACGPESVIYVFARAAEPSVVSGGGRVARRGERPAGAADRDGRARGASRRASRRRGRPGWRACRRA